MNSTLAACKARLMANSLAAVSDVSFSATSTRLLDFRKYSRKRPYAIAFDVVHRQPLAGSLDTPRYPFVPYQLSAIADCGFSIRHVVYWYGDRVAYALRAYQ
jgi:hypothetical protein